MPGLPVADLSLVRPFTHGSAPGRDAAFLVVLALLLSFLFIRTSTRMIRAQVSWWPGNIESGSGLHIHHLVFGIALMLIGGFVAFALPTPSSPWFQLCAIAFGIGAGLTLDEFALWLHLEDVYWSEEGRVSLDAVVYVVALMGLVVLGVRPFGLSGGWTGAAAFVAVALDLAVAILALLKGRIALGLLSLFIPAMGIWAVCRLAKPGSPWARRRYDERKLARARERFPPDSRGARLRERLFTAIGGRPSAPDERPAP